MGLIETVILLSLWTYQGEERKVEGWYHQDNIAACLKTKRYAEKNALILADAIIHYQENPFTGGIDESNEGTLF